jgi:hypothetical protein
MGGMRRIWSSMLAVSESGCRPHQPSRASGRFAPYQPSRASGRFSANVAPSPNNRRLALSRLMDPTPHSSAEPRERPVRSLSAEPRERPVLPESDDVTERWAIVADHSVVRSRCCGVAKASIADGVSPRRPHRESRIALDHGVVHDIGDSAYEHAAALHRTLGHSRGPLRGPQPMFRSRKVVRRSRRIPTEAAS